MININVVRDKERFIWEFTVRGHADYKKRGSDIICAGVSAIAQTAVGALQDLVGYYNYEINEKTGYLKCSIPCDIPENKKEQARIILETIVLGFRQLELTYKKYVSVLDEEV